MDGNRMRKFWASVLIVVFSMLGLPLGVVTVEAQPATGGLRGVARNAMQQQLPQVNVQVRGADGSIVSTGTTNASGQFSFAGLNPGNYVVEILDAAGNIVGTSASVSVTAGAVATITVTAAAAGAIAAAGTGGVSLFGLGTVGTLAVVGGVAAATIATIVATRDDSSPSR
jgi:hypothetical protein